SRATEKLVHYQVEESIEDVISALKPTHCLIALEITTSSKPLHQIKLEASKPIALILGDENYGISEAVLKEVDDIFHIDMFGTNSSMNVVQAASIALYELTKQLNETASNQN
ncbi:MAG TPA: TrmH family RNA methyltransferase, partial [Flavobacteriaceae bacterium]|nr:TrmH family RNA methyltransferase [Flavobacteriaceae bacterium]